jgi:hypothetical protein
MTPEARRLLHALLERTGARIDDLEERFDALERVVFEIDAPWGCGSKPVAQRFGGARG